MLQVRRSQERRHATDNRREAWVTFDARDGLDPFAQGFAGLELFEEGRLLPSASIRKVLQQAEIITYVRDGVLAYEDSLGRIGMIATGEFQRMTAGPYIRYSQQNASPTAWAHVFQVLLRPVTADLEPGHEQKRNIME